uniref:Uncharacterized protein n=1 Tax=Eutreptiella gymnastica TaxID=73025 RepID=A0A7S4FS67_9EUGL
MFSGKPPRFPNPHNRSALCCPAVWWPAPDLLRHVSDCAPPAHVSLTCWTPTRHPQLVGTLHGLPMPVGEHRYSADCLCAGLLVPPVRARASGGGRLVYACALITSVLDRANDGAHPMSPQREEPETPWKVGHAVEGAASAPVNVTTGNPIPSHPITGR